jgi:tight adherence protein C
MPAYVVLAALAITFSIPLFAYTIVHDRGSDRRVTANLNAGLAEGGDLRRLILSESPLQRIGRPILDAFERLARKISPSETVNTLGRRVELAGVAWAVDRLLALKLAAAVGLLVGGLAWGWITGSTTTMLIAVAVGIAAYLLPDAILSHMARARQLAMSNALPDTLDQLTICVEAGLGFDAAMARAARSGSGPLNEEVTHLLQDLRVGVPRHEALQAILDRTDVPELRQFVHALIQAETYGVPVSRILRTQATEQREKRRFRAEERAMKLPVKVIFPLVFCILPVLFIVIIGPAFIHVAGGFK